MAMERSLFRMFNKKASQYERIGLHVNQFDLLAVRSHYKTQMFRNFKKYVKKL